MILSYSCSQTLSEVFFKVFIKILESLAVLIISLIVKFLDNLSASLKNFLNNLSGLNSRFLYGLIRSKKLLSNLPDGTILENCFFENFILADEPFAEALRIFETCVLVNNDLCQKLVS